MDTFKDNFFKCIDQLEESGLFNLNDDEDTIQIKISSFDRNLSDKPLVRIHVVSNTREQIGTFELDINPKENPYYLAYIAGIVGGTVKRINDDKYQFEYTFNQKSINLVHVTLEKIKIQ